MLQPLSSLRSSEQQKRLALQILEQLSFLRKIPEGVINPMNNAGSAILTPWAAILQSATALLSSKERHQTRNSFKM